MRTLSMREIEEISSYHGANRIEVENFLDSVGKMGTLDRELLELFYDARQYDWSSSTIRAIEEGIRLAYDGEERSANSLLINGAKKSRTKIKMTESHD
jgi:hypothetical protein